MSNFSNEALLLRAHEISEQYAGTYLPTAIDNLIKDNDLEKLEYLLNEAEAEMARQEFHNFDMVGENDY